MVANIASHYTDVISVDLTYLRILHFHGNCTALYGQKHQSGMGFYGSNDTTNSVKALKEHTKLN